MKLEIDIPRWQYEALRNGDFDLGVQTNILCSVIHGKEIDEDKLLERVKAEILDNAFSVVNPSNTYEYINVLDLDSIEKIIDKYSSEEVTND